MKLILTTILSLFLTISANAVEVTCDNPKQFADDLTSEALVILKNKSPQVRDELKKLFNQVVNAEWMAKFAAGRYWRKFSDIQKDKYKAAYKDYISNNYVNNLGEYKGQDSSVKQVKELKRGNYLVETTISTPNEPEIAVKYRVKKVGDCFKINDIVVEGVSLITSHRSDFGSILKNKSIDDLISMLESKNEQ